MLDPETGDLLFGLITVATGKLSSVRLCACICVAGKGQTSRRCWAAAVVYTSKPLHAPLCPVAGVLGTLTGGLLLDGVGASVRNALLLCTLGVAGGAALVLLAFAAARTLLPFALAFGAGEFCMFLMAVSGALLCMLVVTRTSGV